MLSIKEINQYVNFINTLNKNVITIHFIILILIFINYYVHNCPNLNFNTIIFIRLQVLTNISVNLTLADHGSYERKHLKNKQQYVIVLFCILQNNVKSMKYGNIISFFLFVKKNRFYLNCFLNVQNKTFNVLTLSIRIHNGFRSQQ